MSIASNSRRRADGAAGGRVLAAAVPVSPSLGVPRPAASAAVPGALHTCENGAEFTGVVVGVPTYNEADNIVRLVSELRGNLPGAVVLVVDDGSPDGTGTLVDAMAQNDTLVHVLHRHGKLGLGTAYTAVFEYARARGAHIAMTMDADFSHRPSDAPAVARAALADGVDLAIGSRYVPGGTIVGWPRQRKALSAVANRLIRASLGITTTDCTASFRAYRVALLERMRLDLLENAGYSALPELLLLADAQGARIAEVPITFVERQLGVTKLTKRELVNSLTNVARMRLRRSAIRRDARSTLPAEVTLVGVRATTAD